MGALRLNRPSTTQTSSSTSSGPTRTWPLTCSTGELICASPPRGYAVRSGYRCTRPG
ncbi:hypothetical protein [Ornithinimicrobium kibberense]|uniref:hypothetical protein n=1 Tax=Ornithinimicrobium kibberense TaxID=282060 RepID=UPI00361A4CD2